jgi:hypothetical protein
MPHSSWSMAHLDTPIANLAIAVLAGAAEPAWQRLNALLGVLKWEGGQARCAVGSSSPDGIVPAVALS